MNGKTARLLNKIALAKGKKLKDLKRHWLGLDLNEKYKQRQEYLQELKSSTKK